MNFKSFTITEAMGLNAKELSKPHGKTGEPRVDILRRLIKDGKPIELKKGGSFVVGNVEDAMSKLDTFEKLPANFSLIDTEGNVVPLTQMAKSKVFGGGLAGAGGGSANTKLTESHQCVMLQAMLDHGMQDIEYFTPEIMKDAYKRVFVDESLDNIIKVDSEDPWFVSSYNIAKLLIQKGYVNKSQTFHRGSADMIKIYAKKSKAFKNMGFANLKDDKWNPGDIWAIQKGFKVDTLPDGTVQALNKALIQHFADRILVGISLKGPEKKFPPPLKEFNNEYPPDTDVQRYKRSLLQGALRGTFWSSKSASLEYDEGTMLFKDNSPGEVVKSEIKGKNARGGGISWGPMSDFIKRETRKPLPKFKQGVFNTAKKITKGNKAAIKVMWIMYNHFYKNESYDDFVKELQQKDAFWISAKLGALYICYRIDKAGGRTANAIVTHFVNYAGSKGSDSSVYVKAGK